MENEYREREDVNPMDAVRGKSARQKYSTEMPEEKKAVKKESVKKTAAKPQVENSSNPKVKVKPAAASKPRRQNIFDPGLEMERF